MIDQKLQAIFSDVFGLPASQFNENLSQDNLEAWDSVMHLSLLLTLEQTFGVTFDPEDGAKLTSVKAIRDALQARMK